jgi:hypothetical protein
MISFKEATEFLSLLNKNDVQYLIIGGVAVNFMATQGPRVTLIFGINQQKIILESC